MVGGRAGARQQVGSLTPSSWAPQQCCFAAERPYWQPGLPCAHNKGPYAPLTLRTCADPALRPAKQDSRVLGATALLFHDRAESLAALAAQQPPASAAAMDFSLWLTRRPPADLPHDRAAFLWWTGVDYRFRRCWHAWLQSDYVVMDTE